MPSGWFRAYNDIRSNPKLLGLNDYDFRVLVAGLWPLANGRTEPGVIRGGRGRGIGLDELCGLLAPVMGTVEGEAVGQEQLLGGGRAAPDRVARALVRLQSAGLVVLLKPDADPYSWVSGKHSAKAARALRQADLLVSEADLARPFVVAVVNWLQRQWLDRKPADTPARTRERKRRQRERERALASGAAATAVTPQKARLSHPVTPLESRSGRGDSAMSHPVTPPEGSMSHPSGTPTYPQHPQAAGEGGSSRGTVTPLSHPLPNNVTPMSHLENATCRGVREGVTPLSHPLPNNVTPIYVQTKDYKDPPLPPLIQSQDGKTRTGLTRIGELLPKLFRSAPEGGSA